MSRTPRRYLTAWRIVNVGSGNDHLVDVFRAWDSDFTLVNSRADKTVRGSVATVVPNKKPPPGQDHGSG